MIRVAKGKGGMRLAARLTRKARAVAQARGADALLARRRDPVRWRMPRLLWPLFTKGD